MDYLHTRHEKSEKWNENILTLVNQHYTKKYKINQKTNRPWIQKVLRKNEEK